MWPRRIGARWDDCVFSAAATISGYGIRRPVRSVRAIWKRQVWPNNLIDLPSSASFPNVRPAAASFGRRRGNDKVEFQDYTKHLEGINVGYRHFTTTKESVSFPFGFGLGYTTFAYSKPVVKATKDGLTASITITNTGCLI